MLADYLLRPDADLDPRNLREDVDRMTGDAERDTGNCGGGKPDDRERIQWSRFDRQLLERHRVSRRHEEVCNREVMAAGAAHPRRVPGIEDPARRGGEKYHAHDRRAVCPQAWLVAVKNPAAALNRRGMVTAAGERPPPGDPI